MQQLGFVSAILAEKPFEEVIDFASENKFACVEIMCWPVGKAERRYAGVTHIDVDELDDEKVNYIQGYLKQKNIFISGLGYYPNPLAADEAKAAQEIEHIKKLIPAAAKLGIPVINTFVGREPSRNVDDNFAVFKERFPEIVQVAEENNINIGIENCPMFFTQDEWPGGKNLAYSPAHWDRKLGDGATTALGDLISPPITLESTPAALEFSYYLQVDDPRPERDRAELAISVAGGPWLPRWAASSSDPLPAEWQDSPNLSLAAYAGQDIRLRFRFDSVDPDHNAGYGWLVDEVRLVEVSAPGPNEAPEIVRVESPPEVQSECACVSCLFEATDPEDGDLSHILSWHSDLDGALGVGTRLRTILSPGQHLLTVSVTDHGGATTTETLTLTITADAESCQLEDWPPAEPRLYCGDDEDEDP